MKMRAASVAYADPRTPIAGAPRRPKMRSQFAPALTRFAATSATITGRTTLIAWRYRLKATYSRSAGRLQVRIDRYGRERISTCGGSPHPPSDAVMRYTAPTSGSATKMPSHTPATSQR